MKILIGSKIQHEIESQYQEKCFLFSLKNVVSCCENMYLIKELTFRQKLDDI